MLCSEHAVEEDERSADVFTTLILISEEENA